MQPVQLDRFFEYRGTEHLSPTRNAAQLFLHGVSPAVVLSDFGVDGCRVAEVPQSRGYALCYLWIELNAISELQNESPAV
jgi:hypothetical protein